MERDPNNRNKKRSVKEQVPKRHCRFKSRQGLDEEALIVSDELDTELASEFPGLKVENENVLFREDEDSIQYQPETLGKAADPVRIYLKELGSFPLLTRKGEVEIA